MAREDKFERALLAYCMAGGAMVIAAQPGHATIIYSGPKNIQLGLGNSYDLDIDNNSVPEFRIYNEDDTNKLFGQRSGTVWAAIDSYGGSGGKNPTYRNRVAASPGNKNLGQNPELDFAHALTAGTEIGPGTSFLPGERVKDPGSGDETDPTLVMAVWSGDWVMAGGIPVKHTTDADGFWLGATDRYLGLVFDIGGADHYAWVRAGIDTDYPLSLDLKDWAYEDVAGKPILAGALPEFPVPVPEPTSLALLALGAAAIPAFLRRRRAERGGHIVRA